MPTTHIPGPIPSGLCKLTQFALISAVGVDAAQFLHSQLTNDIKSLPQNRACLAGYCSNKGRLLASLLIWKSDQPDTIMLQVPSELQEAFQKRLQIFVLRSKLKLNHVTDTNAMLGVLGEDTAAQLTEWFPKLPEKPYDVIHSLAGVLIRLADADNIARYQWILTNQLLEEVWPTVGTRIPVLAPQVWSLSEIHAGIPQITLATQEKFVPQMVNYDLIGGVNFKKGCYPGQEIVARTHYLGKQKRRMVLAQIESMHVQSGMEVFSSDDPTQPCGMIVNAEPNGASGNDCLVEIKTAFLNTAMVQLDSGEVCHWLDMPYPLPANETDSTQIFR